ncbi:MAG: fructose-6-phosphate aldolase [Acidobacteriota bacterium]
MRFFLDTANLDELKTGAGWGIVDGVTTNPSLIAKEGIPIETQIAQICEIVDGDISAEVVAVDADTMLVEGRKLAKIHKNVVVKVPLTRDGIKACSILSKEGIRVNVTLCFSAGQALLAAKAGAHFISPFVGRVDDTGWDGMELIHDIVQIYENFGYQTQILAASLRHTNHVIEAAKAGAHVGTMPFKVMNALFDHPLTDKGLDQFLKDYAKAFGKK